MALGLPGIALMPPDDRAGAVSALRSAQSADVVIFVSSTAVDFAYELRPGLRFARNVRVFAVGAATARALRRHGVKQVQWPEERQDSEGLLALPELKRARGFRVALIGAPGGRGVLPRALRARGAKVEHVHVYKRICPQFTRRHLAALEQANPPLITLVSSAEALANLQAALPLHFFASLAAGDLVVSSERLAGVARELLFRNIHVAASPAPRDLVNAACLAMTRHRL